MASQTSQNTSCVHYPMERSTAHMTDIFMDISDTKIMPSSHENLTKGQNKENSNTGGSQDNFYRVSNMETGKSFEPFVVKGGMILQAVDPTTSPQFGRLEGAQEDGSNKPNLEQNEHSNSPHHQQAIKPSIHPLNIASSSELHSTLALSQNSHLTQVDNCPVRQFPFVRAPVAEMEELSDLSQSSCSESELGLDSSSATLSPCLPSNYNFEPNSLQTDEGCARLEQAVAALEQSTNLANTAEGLTDKSYSEPLSSGDSGFVFDGHVSDPDLTDRGHSIFEQASSMGRNFMSDETLTEKGAGFYLDNTSSNAEISSDPMTMASHAVSGTNNADKYMMHGDRLLVRTSKSHENYLQAGTSLALVNIDIEDGLAYSLDTLTYHDSPESSSDNVSVEQTSRSLDNSPEKKFEKSYERDLIPGFGSGDDSRPSKLKFCHQRNDCEESGNEPSSDFKPFYQEDWKSQSERWNKGEDKFSAESPNIQTGREDISILSDDVDAGSIYHQPCKAVDRPSAERLAKRLFNLEGFRKSDVSRHLCKKNDFSNLVAEEYLKFFDFQEDTLDQALRKFLIRFSLYGETQERERVLVHFSHRFMECNEGSFNSEDACHTLTCAIMLLNSDLHAPNVARRMTCQEFIENLSGLNDSQDFSKEVLKAIYQSIKAEPLEWAVDEPSPEQNIQQQQQTEMTGGQAKAAGPLMLGSNPFLEVPDPNKTTEYKKGYVMRKCCVDSDRRKTPLGKRGWKMLYAVLRDMILYQFKDEHQLKKGHFVEGTHNALRIHHAVATKASDYTKKQHVFRLQTADGAEYLFQTGDSKELQDWVDTINLIAATYSAPVLPGAVGSKRKFQRQLLPASYTRLNLKDQLQSHEARVEELEMELHNHRAAAPEKGTRSSIIQEYLDKESYLELEIKRFKTYVYLLQSKLLPLTELPPSLAETSIGENEEMGAGPARSASNQNAAKLSATKPVQRSLSDRYSYRAAIYQTHCVEYDMV